MYSTVIIMTMVVMRRRRMVRMMKTVTYTVCGGSWTPRPKGWETSRQACRLASMQAAS